MKLWLFVYKFDQFLKASMIRYQCFICQMKTGIFFSKFSIILIFNKTVFTTNKASKAKKTEINVWYVKWNLESSSIIFQSFWLTKKLFSATNKVSRGLRTKLAISRLQKRNLQTNEQDHPLFYSFVRCIFCSLLISARKNTSSRWRTWSKRAKTEISRIDAAPPSGQIL